jgi:hypothetical protein
MARALADRPHSRPQTQTSVSMLRSVLFCLLAAGVTLVVATSPATALNATASECAGTYNYDGERAAPVDAPDAGAVEPASTQLNELGSNRRCLESKFGVQLRPRSHEVLPQTERGWIRSSTMAQL